MAISQECSVCNKKKKLSSFYVNKLNKDGNGHNFWCVDCTKSYVKDKLSMEQYCNSNRREYREELWLWSEAKVKNIFENDVEFNSLSQKEQEKKFIERVINTYFGQHNQIQYYRYIPDNTELINNHKVEIIQDDDNEEDDEPINKKEKKFYSEKWGGSFSKADLNWLEDQYSKSQRDYELKTETDHQYAMNVAISGLIVRKMREEYLNGVTGADKRYKEAIATYDSLCTSAKFNQKTRSENSASGLGSFGETWKLLEEMGFVPIQVTFPKDDVDIILEEYAHSQVALRGALDDGDA